MTTQQPRRCTVYGGRGEPEQFLLELDPEPDAEVPHAFDAGLTPLRSIMSRDLVCARPDLEIAGIVRLVLRHRVGCIPVVDEQRIPIGIIEKLDLVEQLDATIHALEGGYLLPQELQATARDIMIIQDVVLDEHASIATAASTVTTDPVHHVLVVRKDGVLVGVVSSGDIVRWLADNAVFETRRRFATGTGAPPWRPLEG